MFNDSKIKDTYIDVVNCVANIKMNPNQKFMNNLKSALNTLFPDSECLGVLWTPNEDKLFFGTYIMPEIDADDVIKVITHDEVRYRVKKYMVELDGKLFGAYLNLSPNQIAALIVHDIASLTNTAAPCEEVVKSIDSYLIDNHEVLKLSDIVHYKEIFSFGFRDALRKITSIFEVGKYKPHEDTMSEFMSNTDEPYVDNIISAMGIIDKLGYNYNKEVNNKFIGLSWVMRVYKDVLGNRISALKTLDRMQELSPSQIERKEFNNFARRLNRIDDDMLLESTTGVKLSETDPLMEEVRTDLRYGNKVATTNSVDCLDFLKNDLVGIVLKQDNLNANEPDAVPDLLHSINNRMMMIQDYVEGNESDKEAFKQWEKIFEELAKRRDEIAKLNFYAPKKRMVNTYKAQNDQ